MMNETFEDRPFILTNHPGRDKSPTWAASTVEHRPEHLQGVMGDLVKAWQLFRMRNDFDVVVLGGGARYDFLYLLFQALFSFKRVPVIKIDCLWYMSSPLKHFLKKNLFGFLDRFVDKYVVWASREITDYARAFALPEHKFCFIPYHTTIDPNKVAIKNKRYLFSGGNFARDYKTLAEAVDGLDLNIIIACTNQQALEGIDFPSNVRVVGVSHDEFMKLLAESFINVVPLEKGLLHSGGQQTFLNAMLLGKPTIVTDPEGAKDYIENEISGLLVPPEDPISLRQAILQCMENSELVKNISQNGKSVAKRLDTEANLAQIVELAKERLGG